MNGGATTEEATAIVAAIERFLQETAPPQTAPASGLDGWTRAALLEGVARSRSHGTHSWIDP